MRPLATALAFSLLLTPAFARAAEPVFSSQGESSLRVFEEKDGELRIDEAATQFVVEDLSERMYKAVQKTSRRPAEMGLQQSSVITAYATESLPFDRVLWEAEEKGIGFKIHDGGDFVGLREYGCCGAHDVTRLLNRQTGKKVEEALDDSLIFFGINNSTAPHRYLALVADPKAPATRKGRAYVSTVSYFDGSRTKSRVRLYVRRPKGWGAAVGSFTPIAPAPHSVYGRMIWLGVDDTTPADELTPASYAELAPRVQAIKRLSRDADPTMKAYDGIGVKGTIGLPGNAANFRLMIEGDDLAAAWASSEIEVVPVP